MIKKNLLVSAELLRTHATACLNRGEHGEVKTCTFGGTQRIRISSQCSKRAGREAMHDELLTGRGDELLTGRGYRTPQIGELLKKRINKLREQRAKLGVEFEAELKPLPSLSIEDSNALGRLVVYTLSGQELVKEKDNTLLFISEPEIDAIAQIFASDEDREKLLALFKEKKANASEIQATKKAKAERAKKAKAASKAAGEELAPVEVSPEIPEIKAFDDGAFDEIKARIIKAVQTASLGWDIALFGRMTANSKASSVDSALSVSHSITVHEAEPEIDYFSALDDLQREGESGSAHLGEAEFGSGTFYSYACLDVMQLAANLFDKELEALLGGMSAAEQEELFGIVQAWLRAFILAVPRARSNTMNSDSMPNYIRLSIVKDGRAVNHAAAFEGFRINGESIVKTAIKKLESAVKRDEKFFGIKAHQEWIIDHENDEGVPMDQALSELSTVLAQALEVVQ